MTLGDLMTLFRQEADDETAPYMWSDVEVIDYANDAQNEACRRARLIVDSRTAAICTYAVSIGNPIVPLDPRIITIKRAKLTARSIPLVRTPLKTMDEERPGWEALTGQVTEYVPDYETSVLRLFRSPTAADTLTLTVARLPLADMTDPTNDSPEIRADYHRSLRFWMMYRAYSKKDIELLNAREAQINLAAFEAEFGKKSAAFDEEWIREQYGIDTYDGSY